MMLAYIHVWSPRFIFHTIIPPQVLLGSGGKPGIIPDFMSDVAMPPVATGRRAQRPAVAPERRLLWDVKTIWGASGDYLCPRAIQEQSGAVAERAHRVWPDYCAHARRLDGDLVRAGHYPAGATPVMDRLVSYTPTRALVFGQYTEASSDVHDLITAIARSRARRQWRRYGARTEAEALGFMTASTRRHVGVYAAREIARHRLRRAPMVGVPYEVVRDLPVQRPRVEIRDSTHSTAQDFYLHQQFATPLLPMGAVAAAGG